MMCVIYDMKRLLWLDVLAVHQQLCVDAVRQRRPVLRLGQQLAGLPVPVLSAVDGHLLLHLCRPVLELTVRRQRHLLQLSLQRRLQLHLQARLHRSQVHTNLTSSHFSLKSNLNLIYLESF